MDPSSLVLKIVTLIFLLALPSQGVAFPTVLCACVHLFQHGACPSLMLACACGGVRAEAGHGYRILRIPLLRKALLLSGLQVGSGLKSVMLLPSEYVVVFHML